MGSFHSQSLNLSRCFIAVTKLQFILEKSQTFKYLPETINQVSFWQIFWRNAHVAEKKKKKLFAMSDAVNLGRITIEIDHSHITHPSNGRIMMTVVAGPLSSLP